MSIANGLLKPCAIGKLSKFHRSNITQRLVLVGHSFFNIIRFIHTIDNVNRNSAAYLFKQRLVIFPRFCLWDYFTYLRYLLEVLWCADIHQMYILLLKSKVFIQFWSTPGRNNGQTGNSIIIPSNWSPPTAGNLNGNVYWFHSITCNTDSSAYQEPMQAHPAKVHRADFTLLSDPFHRRSDTWSGRMWSLPSRLAKNILHKFDTELRWPNNDW